MVIFTVSGIEYEDIDDTDIAMALEDTNTGTHEAAYMPQFLDLRISADKESRIWRNWYTTQSIKAIGKTRAGNPVVVYAHIPHYFSNPENIRKARLEGFVDGAGKMPYDEFDKLLNAEDNENVFVVDYNTLNKSYHGRMNIEEAIEHPQTIPFCGGRERAERYLAKFREVYGNVIGIWHPDDLGDVPLGLFLCVNDYSEDSIDGDDDFNNDGRFLRVPRKAGNIQDNKTKTIGTIKIIPENNEVVSNEVLEKKVLEAVREGIGFEYKGKLFIAIDPLDGKK